MSSSGKAFLTMHFGMFSLFSHGQWQEGRVKKNYVEAWDKKFEPNRWDSQRITKLERARVITKGLLLVCKYILECAVKRSVSFQVN